MTLLAPISLATIALVGAVCAGLLVIAYILKMRRRRFEVPFSTLWHRVLREKEATAWWKHLRRLLSLLLIAAILALALFAATEPRIGSADKEMLAMSSSLSDASASMQTLDAGDEGAQSRIDAAKERARELLDAMGSGDAAMLMRMDGQNNPTVSIHCRQIRTQAFARSPARNRHSRRPSPCSVGRLGCFVRAAESDDRSHW